MTKAATGIAKLSSPSRTRLDELLEMLRAPQERIVASKITNKLSGSVTQANSLTETRNSELDTEHYRRAVQQNLFERQDKSNQRFLKQVGFSRSGRNLAVFAVSKGTTRPFGATANATRFKSKITGRKGYQLGAMNWVETS